MKKLIRMNKAVALFLGLIVLFGIGIFVLYGMVNGGKDNPEAKENAQKSDVSMLKVGFVTDWEYGTRKQLGAKLTRKAPVELAKAVIKLNEFQPDLVIGGGDYIESSAVKPEDAKAQLKEINDIFSLVEAPRLYAMGNHDLRSIADNDIREILGITENHAIKDIGDWRIVVLDTNFDENGQHRNAKSYVLGGVSEEELEWLSEALMTEKPVLVFSHHSPTIVRDARNIMVKSILNDVAVRNVLEQAGNVAAVFSGHTPVTYHERLNGINYFVADTLVNVNSLGSFVTIEASYDRESEKAEIRFNQIKDKPIQYQTTWQRGYKLENYQSPYIKPEVMIGEE